MTNFKNFKSNKVKKKNINKNNTLKKDFLIKFLTQPKQKAKEKLGRKDKYKIKLILTLSVKIL